MGDQPVPHDESDHRGPSLVDLLVDRGPYWERPTKVPPSIREGPQAQTPTAGAKVDSRSIVPAAVGPYLWEKIHRAVDDKCWWCGGGKKQTHHLFTECRAGRSQITRLEGYREGVRVETPKSPFGQMALEGESDGRVLRFLRGAGVGCISTKRKPPGEVCDGEGSDGEGEEGGPGPP